MMRLNVALAQIEIAFGRPDENMATVRALAATAAARGADLLVLPELWSSGYDLQRAHALAAGPGEGVHAWLAALARAQGIAIVGSTLMQQHGRTANTATFYAADGALLATYEKVHLFGPMHEPEYLAAGGAISVFDAPWGRSALAICYDIRFPELLRACVLQGAETIIVVAAWPAARLEHWRTLLRARAIENQCFIIAANCVGSDPATVFGGHSLVVSPWGDVLVEGGERAELLFASLDLKLIAATRARLRVLHDRRPDVYGL